MVGSGRRWWLAAVVFGPMMWSAPTGAVHAGPPAWSPGVPLAASSPTDTAVVRLEEVGQLGGETTAVTVADGRAYVGVGPRLVVLDVSDPLHPARTGESAALPGSIDDIAVSVEHAYVAAGRGGLQVFDVTAGGDPRAVGSWDSPGYAHAVFAVAGRAYVADEPGGLRVLDIGDPAAPREIGHWTPTHYARTVAVFVSGDHAYVADGNRGIAIVDVRDPTTPRPVGEWGPGAGAHSVWVIGDLAYVGSIAGLYVVDVHDPAAPRWVGLATTGRTVSDVWARDGYAYLAVQGEGVRVVDVRDPDAPREVGAWRPTDYGSAAAVSGDGAHLFVADSYRGVHVLDTSDPTAPRAVGMVRALSYAFSAAADGGHAYVADPFIGLWVVDLGDPRAPRGVAVVDVGYGATRVTASDGHAYAAMGRQGLRIMDVRDPSAPRQVAAVEARSSTQDVCVTDGHAYLADGWSGLRVVDVHDPAAPREVGTADTAGDATAVDVRAGRAYVVGATTGPDAPGGLHIIDVRDPGAPREVGRLELPDLVPDVAASGGYAYVMAMGSEGDGSLHVVDVRDPTAPRDLGPTPMGGIPRSVSVRGDRLYVSFAYMPGTGGAGVLVFDVRDPATLREIGSWRARGAGHAVGIHVSGDYAYVATAEGGLTILRITEATGAAGLFLPLAVRTVGAAAESLASRAAGQRDPWTGQGGGAMASAVLATEPGAQPPVIAADRYVPPPSPRQVLDIADTWRFHFGDVPGAEDPPFDDGSWSTVTVPHTWNARDGQDGGNDYARGVAWYRTRIRLPADLAERKLFLEFGAANLTADVWLNGQLLGRHRGGYAAFRMEATSIARFDGDNVLAVRVSNALDPDTPPLAADYTMFGGLYRPVRLVVTDRLHVRMLDAGGPGVYITPTGVTTARAEISVAGKVWNSFPEPRPALVRTVLVDAGGQVAATLIATVTVGAGTGLDVVQHAVVDRPHLWAGRADPYLYTAYMEIREGDIVRDVVSQTVGIRSVGIDPARGFLLNGATYPLRGVNRHQDREDRGWAIGPAEHAEDMRIIAEMGANAVRLAHYPQDPLVYDLADRMGLVLWVEVPVVNRVADTDAFRASARNQVVEMIRQGYNHPSIALWGIGNEVTLDRAGPDPNPLLAELAGLARSEDPVRLTTIAQCCTDEGAPDVRHTDAVGYNRYFGWYGGPLGGLGPWADRVHAAYPDLAIAVSEYGAGASIHHHGDTGRLPDPGGVHPEAYQALVHEAAWTEIAQRPFLWGTFVWNMFDFASDDRREGERAGINDKGLVTYDRRVYKDAWWWYRVSWNDAPAVYITARRHDRRSSPTAPVKVYANTDRAHLVVNGRDAGWRSVVGHIALWPDVALGPGANRLVAEGEVTGSPAVVDEVTWTRVMPVPCYLPVAAR
jgi:beta-galactosidase